MIAEELVEFASKWEAHLRKEFSAYGLPMYMEDGIIAYIIHGVPTGDFLGAVLSNDFVDAVGRADLTNTRYLKEWAQFVYGVVPASPIRAWGSREIVENWKKVGGIVGLKTQEEVSDEQQPD